VNRFEVYAYIGNQTHENKGRAVKCFSIVKFHLQRAKKRTTLFVAHYWPFAFQLDGFRRIQDTTLARNDCSAIYGTSCWLIGWRSRDPDKIPSFHCLSLDRITDWMAQPFYINRYKKCSLIIYVELLCSYLYMTVAFLSEKIYTRLYRLLTSIMELKFLLSNFQRISLEQSFDTNVITVLYKADTSNFHREDF
jgi:hypothetical protein